MREPSKVYCTTCNYEMDRPPSSSSGLPGKCPNCAATSMAWSSVPMWRPQYSLTGVVTPIDQS